MELMSGIEAMELLDNLEGEGVIPKISKRSVVVSPLQAA